MICPIPHKQGDDGTFEAYEGMRKDVTGKYWCKSCQDEFDSIDWEEVAEKRMGM